ncbi:hypothetical protein TELCIR_11438 [Teladorsagia circumcincta]|uniref:Uncharacterized protein n=1 Tax=Teladorsagia circumcincta TaxID=45464 RepID=A0A2G9U9H5_TELCI|nr:hypothetical protein TELCIR_11438 [Teladorsagia circumcincta]
MDDKEHDESIQQSGSHDTPEYLILEGAKFLSSKKQFVTSRESAAIPLVNGTVTETSTVDSGSEAVAEGSSVGSATAVEAEVDKDKSAPSQPTEEPEVDNRTFTVTGLRHPGGWRTHSEVVMHTEEQVEAARSEDGFELDDGQQQSVLRILTPVEYAKFVEEEQKPIPFVPPEIEPPPAREPPASAAHPTASAPADAKLAPVLDEDDVTDMFIKYVTDQRVNWAEITDVMELYTMCDAVSAQIGGLPDSVLRPAMLHTLQRHLTEAQTAWMREHLQDLIKGWKQEVRRDAFVDRPTLVQMKAAEYVPVAPSRKRLRGKNSAESRAGRVMMGVGALLEAQRQKGWKQEVRRDAFVDRPTLVQMKAAEYVPVAPSRKRLRGMITEEGELEVEEDEQGNIMLGGEALSFESWAK